MTITSFKHPLIDSNMCSARNLSPRVVGETYDTHKAESIFDELKSQTNLMANKTSRLNQRLMKGVGGVANNVVGSLSST